MKNKKDWNNKGFSSRRQIMFCKIFGGMLVSVFMATSHPQFLSYIQHHLDIEIFPSYMDCTVQILFCNNAALDIRNKLDKDQNDRISPEEVREYLKTGEDALIESLKLFCGERRCDLYSLYPPGLELMHDDRIAPTPVEITLYLSSRIKNTECPFMKIHDELFPKTPAIISWRLNESRYGYRIASPTQAEIVSSDIHSVSRTLLITNQAAQHIPSSNRVVQ